MVESSFWAELPRPMIGLAPMNGITDHAFRHIQKKYGGPMVLYTEFTGVERVGIGDPALLEDLLFDETQRPIIGQIFGQTPELFRRMAILLCELGFDGIDINMGCPAPNVVQRGSGAGLIQTPELALEIVAATRLGVAQWRNGATVRDDPEAPSELVRQVEARCQSLPAEFQQRRAIPVSVKTRIGYATSQVREWIPRLLESEPAAIAIHGRTLQQGYTGQADWDAIACATELAHDANTLMLGNGDIRSLADAYQRVADTGVDGVLIGRASYGNPFVFRPDHGPEPSKPERHAMLRIALEHAYLYEASLGRQLRNRFMAMRKHLSWYARGLPGAAGLRRELIEAFSAHEVEQILIRYAAYRQTWERAAGFSSTVEGP